MNSTGERDPLRSVLILWADHSSANLGVQALAAGTAALVTSTWPSAAVDFFQHNDLSARQPVRVRLANLTSAYVWPRHLIRRWLASYDAIIDIGGGDSFTDIYGTRRMLSMTMLRLVAGRSTNHLILGPQTIGPFRHWWSRWLSRWSLRRASLVIARDSASQAYGRTGLGIDPQLGTDVAFALPVPGTTPARFDVLFNVSGLLWNSDDHTNAARYQAACVHVCDRLRATGRRVALLVHVRDNASTDNDSAACVALADRLLGEIEIVVPNDLADVRVLLRASQILIGARMHACLNALSVGVPAIAWAYSRKFEPLLGDLAWNAVLDVNRPDLGRATLSLVHEIDRNGTAMVQRSLGLARTRVDVTQRHLSAALVAIP